jgi:hypothetical protein
MRALGYQFLPAPTEPDTASLGSQNGTIQIPLSAREFEASRDNLFATTFNNTTSDQVTCCPELSIAHTLDVIAKIGQRLFCEAGLLG